MSAGLAKSRSPARRKSWHPLAVLALFSALMALFYNQRFWRLVFDYSPTDSVGDWAFLFALCVFLGLWINLFLQLTGIRYLMKPLLIGLLLVAALANYFSSRYGTVIDPSMIRNVLETDREEAGELLSGRFLGYMSVYFLLPAMLLIRLPLRWHGFGREWMLRLLVVIISLLLLAAIFLLFNKPLTFLFRQHTELRSLVIPTYPVHAVMKYWQGRHPTPKVLRGIGLDAHRGKPPGSTKRPVLLVLVVGETARAENFSLNGYARNTNPELSSLDVLYLPHTSSCATSTAESLPCMFSRLSKPDYSRTSADREENLLDVLAHAGIASLWIDNQSGCKGICDRVQRISTRHANDPAFCADGHCHDEVMLPVLEQRLRQAREGEAADLLVVLHPQGSHGPAYFKRVPEAFRRYRPECRSVNLQECSREQVVNSYDNTILYTDHFLARLIRLLDSYQEEYDTLVYYVSDHGESLGENNIYLHGMPDLLAPEQQTHVPAIFWFSRSYRDDHGLDMGCMRGKRDKDYTHDHLFHTILGVFSVATDLYDPALDMLKPCRLRK